MDTSFVVHALLPRQRFHDQCRDFLTRLAEGDGTVFFNRLLELELAEVAFKSRCGSSTAAGPGRQSGLTVESGAVLDD